MRNFIMWLGGLCIAMTGFSVKADDSFVYWPGANYDTSIPTLEKIVGHTSGERISTHADMVRYFEALAAAAPDRIKLFDYGETWEGRRLIYVAISSAENIKKLADFKNAMQALMDPRKTSKTAATKIIKNLPASTWLAYGVHGNEISSSDAAMQTAYHLLASKGDQRVPEIMAKTITFIAPMQNPDGRDRFIHRFRTARGMIADSDPISAEHNEPWPSGRTNHYLFDMNRDWIVLTQPETQGHVKALQNWYPLVFVDLHEMGGNSSYYFAPEAVPFNPHLAQDQRDNLFLFGKTNAKWFDKFGKRYFTRDVFDAFYPGYGASWPAYYGAVAMTYEQASSRGLIYHRNDGTDLLYRETIKGHFITSMATLETTAANRKKLLDNFYAYQVTAIKEGRDDKKSRTYIFPNRHDLGANRKLAGLLAEQGIEVQQAAKDFKACGVQYQKGAYIIDTAQPRKRMIRTLLDPQVDMNSDWVAEQERLRTKNVDHDIYDVTAWSLPLMFNVKQTVCGKQVSVDGDLVSAQRITPGILAGAKSEEVVYLVPADGANSARFMAAALRANITLYLDDKSFTLNGRHFSAGSLIINRAENGEDIRSTLKRLAKETGAEVVASSTTWLDSGADFGGRYVRRVHAPKIAMAWDAPTNQLSAGNTRFVIEQQFGYPVTVIRTQHLTRANLARYQVLILPDSRGSYQSTLTAVGAKNIADWVKKGGVLIGTGSAVRYLSAEKVNLLSLKLEAQVRRTKKKTAEIKAKNGRIPGTLLTSAVDMQALIEPSNERPDSVPGVLANATVDPDHWLSAGLAPDLKVLIRGSDIYAPINLEKGTNVVWFQGADSLLASGHMWKENQKQYAFKPFVVVEPKGRGMVIGFTQDPTVRAYMDGLNQVFFNAIFSGAAHASPLR